MDITSEDLKFNQHQSIAIFRILQEALTNIMRHANATSVKISLVNRNSNLELQIHDNGIGISSDRIDDKTSTGITGMRERINFLDGKFDITGNPNRGTVIKVTVPMGAKV